MHYSRINRRRGNGSYRNPGRTEITRIGKIRSSPIETTTARRPFVPMEIGHGRGVDVVLPQPFTKRAKKKHEEEEAAKERRKRRSEPATTGGCIDFRFISLVAFVGEISLVGPLVKIALSN